MAGMAYIGFAVVMIGIPLVYSIAYGLILPILFPKLATSKTYSPTIAVVLGSLLGMSTFAQLNVAESGIASEDGFCFLVIVIALTMVGLLDYFLGFRGNVVLRDWHGAFKQWYFR